jgi:hypothetical protein
LFLCGGAARLSHKKLLLVGVVVKLLLLLP